MSKVCLVTGIGHAGTKWLAHVLNRPEQGVHFEHEMAYRVTRKPWKVRQQIAVEKGVGYDAFPNYWEEIDRLLKVWQWVGDSMSWHPIEAEKIVQGIGHDARVIYLVRNGVQQLHSIANHSTWGNVPGDHWLYHTYLRRYWELAGSPGKAWEDWTKWEKLCLWWASNNFAAEWLRLRFKETFVLRLEDLVQRAPLLEEVMGLFGVQRYNVGALQGIDMNRKVPGDRSPEALWARWTPEERAAFVDICGMEMSAFDYDIPED